MPRQDFAKTVTMIETETGHELGLKLADLLGATVRTGVELWDDDTLPARFKVTFTPDEARRAARILEALAAQADAENE